MTITIIIGLVLLFALILGYVLLSKKTDVLAASINQRLDIEKQIAESIRKVENIFAGTATKGSAGENVAEMFLSNLPPEWLVRNLPINNKRVEYAVRLPDGLAVPIDVKWPATDVLQQFLVCEDHVLRGKLKATIQSTTKTRALEMRKYLDPTITTRFGLVVVPEPVFELCSEILPVLSQEGILLVSCNMLLPYVLLLVHMTIKSLQRPDARRLDAFAKEATASVQNLQYLLQRRFSNATSTLETFRSEMTTELRNLNASLSDLQTFAAADAARAEIP